MSNNIIITGAGGMLGKELLYQLSANNDSEIYSITSQKDSLSKDYPDVTFYNRDETEKAIRENSDADALIHCSFARSMDEDTLKRSVDYTEHIYAVCSSCGIPEVINISSRSVYGQNPNIPWTESSECDGNTPYANAKIETEQLAQSYTRDNTKIYNIRLAGLLTHDFKDRLPNKLVNFALKNRKLFIKGGKQQFAYLDLRDAANGLIRFVKTEKTEYEPVYNLGANQTFTILEIAQKIEKQLKKRDINIEIELQKDDTSLYDYMDCSLFGELTGWRPKYSIEDTIDNIINYTLKEGNK